MIIDIPDKGMKVEFPDDMDMKEVERQIYTQVYDQDVISPAPEKSFIEKGKDIATDLYQKAIDPWTVSEEEEAFRPDNPPDIDVMSRAADIKPDQPPEKTILSYAPYMAVKAVKGAMGPLLSPLKTLGMDSEGVLNTAAEFWKKRLPDVGIPNAGIVFDEKGDLDIQRIDDMPISEIVGATSEGAGFLGPASVALKGAGLITAKLAQYARPFYRSILKGMIGGALLGEGKKDETLESMAMFGLFEGAGFAIGEIPSLVKNIKGSNAYRTATIKERGLVIQDLETTMKQNPGISEADLVKTSDAYFAEAMARRRPEGVPEAPPPPAAPGRPPAAPRQPPAKVVPEAVKPEPVADMRTGGMTPEIIKSIPDPVVRAFAEGRLSTEKPKVEAPELILTDAPIPEGSIKTGKPIKYHYTHNIKPSPDKGKEFAQDIEPSGKYIAPSSPKLPKFEGLEKGVADFKNPLVLEHKTTRHGGWKTDLSNMYDGKTGEELTKAISSDGYDGIITLDKGRISEGIIIEKPAAVKKETPAKIAEKINTELPEHGIKYDGEFDRTALKKGPLYQFTPQSGPLKGRTLAVEELSIDTVKNKLKEMQDAEIEKPEAKEKPAAETPKKEEPKAEAEGVLIDPDLIHKLDTMQNEVNTTRTKGVTQEKPGQEGETIAFSADSPRWMQDLQKARKADKKTAMSRKGLNVLFNKVREGKPLTEIQSDQYAYLEKAINEYAGEAGEFIETEKATDLEKKGFEVYGGAEIPVADLNPGDTVVATIDGVKDTYVVKGINKEGERIFQDGMQREVHMFDDIKVEGLKKKPAKKKPIKESQGSMFGEPEKPKDLFGTDLKADKAKQKAGAKEKPEGPVEQQPGLDLGKDFQQEKSGQGKMFASTGTFADIPVQAMEMPEITKLAKELLQGKYPQVKAALGRKLGVLGDFLPSGEGRIRLKADLFKDITQAQKTLAHEIGHLVDYLDDKTMKRGNILGRIASLKKFMKRTMESKPGGGGSLTIDDKKRIRSEAKNLLKADGGQWIDEIIIKETPVGPQNILDVWNSVEGSLNKDLTDYIKRLSSAEKKAIVKAALKGKVLDAVKYFGIKEEIKTGKKIKIPREKGDLDKVYKDLIEKETQKRKLLKWDDIQTELKEFTQKWKPFSPGLNQKYTKYRFSSPELYADALSAIITNPGYIKEHAPKFFEAFYNFLENKTMVKNIYAEIMATVNKTPTAKAKTHIDDILEMFKKSTEKRNIAIAADRVEPVSVKDELLNSLWDKSHGALKVIRQLEKIPGVISKDAGKARMALQELQHTSSVTGVYLSDFNQIILKSLEKAGITLDELGVVGFYERIAKGDRGDKANPLGIDQATAERDLSIIGKELWGKEKFDKIKGFLQDFRKMRNQEIYSVLEESNILKPKLMEYIKANPHHVKWDVAAYFDKTLGAHGKGTAQIYRQIGTLNEIDNPIISTVLQDISLLRSGLINMTKQDLVRALRHTKSIAPAQLKYSLDKKGRVPVDPGKGKGVLTVFEKSSPGTPHYYYVSKDIADIFEYAPGEASHIFGMWFTASRVAKELMVGKNPAWMLRNLNRDIIGAIKNTPGVGLKHIPKILKIMIQVAPEVSKEAYKKLPSPRIRDMKKMRGLPQYRMWSSEDVTFDNEIMRQLTDFKLLPDAASKSAKVPGVIRKIWDAMDNTGYLSEIWSKVTIDKFLNDNVGMMEPRDRARITRELAGTPDSRQKSRFARELNSFFLFSEMRKAGIRQAITAFKLDKTGYAWKTFTLNMLPSMLKYLLLGNGALLGTQLAGEMFGDDAERIVKRAGQAYNRIPEWDLEHYEVYPVGLTDKGEAVYLRFPMDYEGQVFGTIGYLTAKEIYNQIRGGGDPAKTYQRMFKTITDQRPYNLHPFITILQDMAVYSSGGNPKNWKGYDVIPKRVYNTGGTTYIKESIPYIAREIWGNTGMGSIWRFGNSDIERDKEWYKQALSAWGGNAIGSYIKFSDRGISEKIRRKWELTRQVKAKQSLEAHKAVINIANGKTKTIGALVKEFTTPGVTSKKIAKTMGLKSDNVYIRMLMKAKNDTEKILVLIELSNDKGE